MNKIWCLTGNFLLYNGFTHRVFSAVHNASTFLFVSWKKDSIQFWKDRKSGMIFKTDAHDAHWELTVCTKQNSIPLHFTQIFFPLDVLKEYLDVFLE